MIPEDARAAILDALTDHEGGLTAVEIADYMGLELADFQSQLAQMAKAGTLERAGTRYASDHAPRVVWAVVKS